MEGFIIMLSLCHLAHSKNNFNMGNMTWKILGMQKLFFDNFFLAYQKKDDAFYIKNLFNKRITNQKEIRLESTLF